MKPKIPIIEPHHKQIPSFLIHNAEHNNQDNMDNKTQIILTM
jgi:hypothetical protein